MQKFRTRSNKYFELNITGNALTEFRRISVDFSDDDLLDCLGMFQVLYQNERTQFSDAADYFKTLEKLILDSKLGLDSRKVYEICLNRANCKNLFDLMALGAKLMDF